LICGSDHEDWGRTERVAASTGGLAALGVHPWVAGALSDPAREAALGELAARAPAVIGEIGLDTLWAKTDDARARQREVLRAQLALARERDVPVVLHCVRAYPELLALLERDGVPAAGGVMHAWSGPADQIPRAVALGLWVSFGPLVQHDRARKARASVPQVPDDRLLVETDCPDMKGPGVTRGEPAHLPAVVAAVAALRGSPPEHVAAITARNARTLFPFGP
jgi:TatD DNase family protein